MSQNRIGCACCEVDVPNVGQCIDCDNILDTSYAVSLTGYSYRTFGLPAGGFCNTHFENGPDFLSVISRTENCRWTSSDCNLPWDVGGICQVSNIQNDPVCWPCVDPSGVPGDGAWTGANIFVDLLQCDFLPDVWTLTMFVGVSRFCNFPSVPGVDANAFVQWTKPWEVPGVNAGSPVGIYVLASFLGSSLLNIAPGVLVVS